MKSESKSMLERTRRVLVRFFGRPKAGLGRARLIGLVAIVALISCAALSYAVRAYKGEPTATPEAPGAAATVSKVSPTLVARARGGAPARYFGNAPIIMGHHGFDPAAAEGETQGKPTPAGPSVQGIHVAFHSYGFEPAEIVYPKGAFRLFIENRTGMEEPVFRLDRVTGSRMREARLDRKKRYWAEVFDLSPGSYVLSEANHPKMTCSVEITAR